MNILQVNKFYYPEVGGIERVVQNVAEGLSDQYSMSVLAARSRGLGRIERHNGVDVTKVSGMGVTLSVPISPTFPVRFRSMTQNADIIHHHLPNPLSTVSQLSVDTGEAAVVATYHNDIVRQSTTFRAYRPVLTRFLDRVDRILVSSERLLDNSKVLGPYQNKCKIVPLSIDLDTIDTENSVPLNVDPCGPVVLFVGRLTYYKGVEYLVDAMQEVNAALLVAGKGPRRNDLERRAEKRGVSDRVRFLGYVLDERLPSLYRAADLFVLPSVEPSESFGIVQLEAMARGVPVVNTDLPTGVPWVSKHGETGITVPPRDSTALAEAINEILADGDKRRLYGQRARSRVEQLFTRERMLRSIEDVYSSLKTGDT